MRQSLEDWQKNHTAISHAVVQHWYISVLFFQILLYTMICLCMGLNGYCCTQVTAAELAKRKEEEQQQLQAQAQAAKLRESRTAHEDEYERLVSVANSNRDDDIVDAHGLDTALAQMSSISAPELPADRHPERRLKASFKAFEEAEMPVLKQEKPGLTHTQYKDMLWKLWKKSPDNPLNQAS
jgi:hypothetical protein